MMYHVEYSEKEQIMGEYGEMKSKKASREELAEMLKDAKIHVELARAEG